MQWGSALAPAPALIWRFDGSRVLHECPCHLVESPQPEGVGAWAWAWAWACVRVRVWQIEEPDLTPP